MKGLLYSKTLKMIAVLLVISFCAIGAYQLADLAMWDMHTLQIYNFESSFGDSSFVNSLLAQAEWRVDSYLRGEEKDPAQLADALAALSAEGQVFYYVSINGQVLTNHESGSAEELCRLAHYKQCVVSANGAIAMETSMKDAYCFMNVPMGTEVLVVSALQPACADGMGILWEMEEQQFFDHLLQIVLCAFLFLGSFVYLISVAGRDRHGTEKSLWIDRIFVEVHLAFLAGSVLGGCFLWVWTINDGRYLPPKIWIPASLLIGAATGALALTSSLSLVRKIKHRDFLRSSMVFLFLRGAYRLILRLGKVIGRGVRSLRRMLARTLFQKTAMIFCTFLMVYTAVIALCGVFVPHNPLAVCIGVMVFLVGCFFLGYRGADLDRVKQGIRRVREGELHPETEPIKCEDLRMVAEDISGIAEGMERAVAERVRAERMKTELITNVSHDLKTPLTSIISYTELLSGVEGLSEEARAYVAVIAGKCARLKKLTQDLFDISKVQSGNEDVEWERMDGALLVEQTLGEYDREIQASGLTFCVNTDKELYFQGDGRKLSRVLGNLLENILKYTMPGTRVFVCAERTGDRIRLEWKNVSAYPLNFDAEEIVGRFARGDEARSTEGNGLGLAIARSYTELCGGELSVIVDGDLFKVVLTFPAEK